MSICKSLIDTAAAACPTGEICAEKVAAVVLKKQNPDGGFRGKGPQSDLYYTGFAVMNLSALEHLSNAAEVSGFLDRFGFGDDLDLAHLSALIRCRRLIGQLQSTDIEILCEKVEAFRCKDGAYHHLSADEEGSAYGCFLALGAYQDLGCPLPEEQAVIECLQNLKANGGYCNESALPLVSTPATAAAVTTLAELAQPIDIDVAEWLMTSRDPNGGFKVTPAAPMADLLSTAVALHALRAMKTDLSLIRSADMTFAVALWDETIGFRPNVTDHFSDCEYCFYGLLSLGHLK